MWECPIRWAQLRTNGERRRSGDGWWWWLGETEMPIQENKTNKYRGQIFGTFWARDFATSVWTNHGQNWDRNEERERACQPEEGTGEKKDANTTQTQMMNTSSVLTQHGYSIITGGGRKRKKCQKLPSLTDTCDEWAPRLEVLAHLWGSLDHKKRLAMELISIFFQT